jgi:hypothetical protein
MFGVFLSIYIFHTYKNYTLTLFHLYNSSSLDELVLLPLVIVFIENYILSMLHLYNSSSLDELVLLPLVI